MEFTYFIGIDVSKNELDFAVLHGKNFLFHKETANTAQAISGFMKDLNKLPDFSLSDAVFCMEHTGIYNNPLVSYLHKNKGNCWLESALQIKNSMGNLRGKNDKVDAIRIAEYAYKNREEVRLWKPKRAVINQLSHYTTLRARLISSCKMLSTPLKEGADFMDKSLQKQANQLCKKAIDSIKESLKRTEKIIDQIIASDEELNRLFSLITSVTGIGPVTAVQVLITTNEFKDISNPKKFACYSGVAPFVRESGIFRGRGRVSHLADKTMKKLLHMSALSAITSNGELKNYYERKVSEEKKNKMLVLNAVRNKLILRIFTCVAQNRKYQKDYDKSVA
ncbi:IS110 family RNA-guided transposase [Aquirufa salirivi]|uniref:IS110 family transposase n=1 Tax=Aquirufa salirivi TaxID=3104729 RepID=A0ABW8RVY2_9BACT